MQRTRWCVCGHAHETHEHYRRGSECAICGAAACPRFRRRLFWRANRPLTATPPARSGEAETAGTV